MLKNLFKRLFTLKADLQGNPIFATDSSGKNPIAVNGVVTVYTLPILISRLENCGYAFQCTAGANPNITITPQESLVMPAAANVNAADPNYVTPQGVSSIGPLQNTTMVQGTLSLVPMKYVRFQIVGNTGNGTDTVVSLGLFVQEHLS